MKKVVGILTRPVLDRFTINREITDVILEYQCLPIGVIPPSDEGTMTEEQKQDLFHLLDFCDGFIFQGGTYFYEYDIVALQYLYQKDVPVLGVCLGMQSMAVERNGNLEKIGNHIHDLPFDYVHSISIKKDSKLYEIFRKNTILVNSRHQERVKTTNLNVVAISSDGVIEAVEDPNKRFWIGVEWHPESIMDDNSKLLFQSFFNTL